MGRTSSQWPTKSDYDIAMRAWEHTLIDPQLRAGRLTFDGSRIRSHGGANNYVCIYRIDDWMVRCFRSNPPYEPPDDILVRYRAIDQFCRTHSSAISALVPCTLVEKGIYIRSQSLPIVKMQYVNDALRLGTFIAKYYRDSARMLHLCQAWLRMVRELEESNCAHGDLDLTNVLVQEHYSSITLRLVDYDAMWVEALAGRQQYEYGHEDFQHPAFLSPYPRPFNVTMDRFSALSIYISIKAIAARPELYGDPQWHADDTHQLLLSQHDYKDAESRDKRIAEVSAIDGLAPYIDELRACLRERRMPRSLSDIERDSMHPAVVQPPVIARVPTSAQRVTPTARQGAPASPPPHHYRHLPASSGHATHYPSHYRFPAGGGQKIVMWVVLGGLAALLMLALMVSFSVAR